MKKSLIIAVTCLLVMACEKEITLDLNSADPQIVIDGAVTNQPGPYYVNITQTINVIDKNDYPKISDALVVIEDDLGLMDTLTELNPGRYQTRQLQGEPGRTYTLRVTIEDQEYLAVSTMPDLVPLDSLRFNLFTTPASTDEVYATVPIFKDPISPGNNYRFIQTINGELDQSYVVFNDNINNGLLNERPIFSPEAEIALGDTVRIEMRCLDLSAYQYFFTLSQIEGGGPGGSTTPTNPPNNIIGDNVVGLFSAYTTQFRTQRVE